MNKTANANLQANRNCSCQHPDDCCPACYAERRVKIQQQLWDATLAVARLQQAALELEKDFQLHRRSHGYRNRFIIQCEILGLPIAQRQIKK